MPAAPEDVNVPSDPAPQTMGELPGFKFNLGHQETDRIIDELEQVCKQIVQSAGDSWMTCTAAANIVCTNLGYEDQGELEDAIKCDWEEFIKSMPHLETKIQDDNSYAQGRLVFRMKPLVPVHDRKMFILSFTVKSRQDLWRVCHKAPSAVLEFPDMEFEIGADARRKIDSLYNHIAAAVYNLSMHVSTMGSQISQGHKDAFSETIDKLNVLLDVEEPFTILLHDRTGISEIRPADEVITNYGGAAEMDPLEAEEMKMREMMLAIDEVNGEETEESVPDDKVTVTEVD
jgi:C4-type Zn-finger protein